MDKPVRCRPRACKTWLKAQSLRSPRLLEQQPAWQESQPLLPSALGSSPLQLSLACGRNALAQGYLSAIRSERFVYFSAEVARCTLHP